LLAKFNLYSEQEVYFLSHVLMCTCMGVEFLVVEILSLVLYDLKNFQDLVAKNWHAVSNFSGFFLEEKAGILVYLETFYVLE